MVSLAARTVELADATLVAATLTGGSVPTRVTVTNRLGGPVWPPRRAGVPEDGWDEEGFEGVVPAGGTVPLGYACPAPAREPPLEVVATEPAEGEEGPFPSAESVLRGLGSPAPPREAVPVAGDGGVETAEGSGAERSLPDSASQKPVSSARAEAAGSEGAGCDPQPAPVVPDAVASWLDRLEGRIERAEGGLGPAERAATAAARGDGGKERVATGTVEPLAEDAACLRELAKRATALADRAERARVAGDGPG